MGGTNWVDMIRYADGAEEVSPNGGELTITKHNVILTPNTNLEEIETILTNFTPKPGDVISMYVNTFGIPAKAAVFIDVGPLPSSNIQTPAFRKFVAQPGDTLQFVWQENPFGSGYWQAAWVGTDGFIDVTLSADTVSAGEGRRIALAPEAGNTDNVNIIAGGYPGTEVIFRVQSDSHEISFTPSGTGNIYTFDGKPITLRDTKDYAIFRANGEVDGKTGGTEWSLVSYRVQDPRENPLSPRVQYQRINFDDLTGGLSSEQLNIGAVLPDGAEVIDVITNVRTQFTSGNANTTDLQASTGVPATGNEFHGDVSLFQAPARYFGPRGNWASGDGAQIVAQFTALGGAPDFAHLTAGVVDFYILYYVIPDIA